MIDDGESVVTIVLGDTMGDDTITISSDDMVSLTDYAYDNSLSTSLPYTYSSATLGTATAAVGSAGGGGASGATLTTTTGGSLMWNNTITSAGTPYTITSGGGNLTGNWTTYNNQPTILKVEGDAEFKGEVTIRGVKLDERLTAIEERLGILRPNNDLEGKWEKLKALGEEYRKLEQEILEGENIWDILKK
jgi:hypothetical protein